VETITLTHALSLHRFAQGEGKITGAKLAASQNLLAEPKFMHL
jgi:hypothetical protein